MACLTFPVLFLCWFITPSLLVFYQFVVTPLNSFRKHAKCMTLNQIWYVMLTFFVLMWMTFTIMTQNRLTSVINFRMCTKLTTGCLSTSCGGIFSFGDVAFSLSMLKLFTKRFVNRERWIQWDNMSFGIWFAWQILTPHYNFCGHNNLVFGGLTIRYQEVGWI